MPNLFSRPGVLRWAPNASEFGAPPGALLRADNLDFEEQAIIRLRNGSATVYSGLGSTVHSLYTAYFEGTRCRLAGVDDKVYANGVDLGRTFDGSGDIAFCSWLGQVFMARGDTRLKYDGSVVTNWGIPKPSKRLTAAAGDQIQEFFATCNQTESPAFTASEGTITVTYPDGADGTANGSIEVTPAATGRATITKTFTSALDYWNIDGYSGSATDIIDLLAWFDKPEEVESVTIMFGVSPTEASDPFRDDYYTFTFKIGGSATTAPQQDVIVKSAGAVTSEITERLAADSIGGGSGELPEITSAWGPSKADSILNRIEDIPESLRGVIDYRPDASYNPGWTHLTVSRGELSRQGTSEDRDWETLRAVRIVYKAKAASTGKARFDSFQIYGGGERALTGKFSFLYRLVRAIKNPNGDFEYAEKSPPSDPSPYVNFRTQRADLTVPDDAVASFDEQANQMWIYMTGGYLNDWYKVAVAGTEPNDTSMAIDEFARSPDGQVSSYDRTRFNQFGLSIPGSSTPFSPDTISGLKLWLDAQYITNVSEGSPVAYWPGRSSYSAFTPTDVSGLKAWYKADAGVYSDAGVTLATNGDTVQQWNDQTASGYNLSQATGSLKPIYKTGIVNGRPVVRFDGIDDVLTGTTMSNLFAAGAKYAIVVFYPNVLTTGTQIWSSTTADYVAQRLHATSGLLSVNFDGSEDTAASAISAGSWYMGIMSHGTNDWTADAGRIGCGTASGSFMGDLTVAASGNTTDLTTALRVGGRSVYFNGDIAELMFFNIMPSRSERLKLERYLAAKYNLTYNYGADDDTYPARAGSASLQPTYKSSWRNSKPAVYFDGSESMEISAAFADVAAVGAKTIFLVGEVDALMGAPAGAGSNDNNLPITTFNSRIAVVSLYSGSLQAFNNDSGGNDYSTARAYALDVPYIWTFLHSGGTIYQGQNDTRTASMNTATSGDTVQDAAPYNGWQLGAVFSGNANVFFKGHIAEVLIYNEALTEANRKSVESYLASKYGLQNSIPYGLTQQFVESGTNLDDLIVTLAASEQAALIENERLPSGLFRPPEDIISMDAPYAERLWALTSKGYLYFSLRREPGMFKYSHAYKVGDTANTPYWVRRTSQGVYVGTARDICWIYGPGDEDPDTGIPGFTKIQLNVADPPISSAVCNDGNDLIYMSARGPMRLTGNETVPVQLGETSLLWKGETRHGVSGVNLTTGRFSLCASHGDVYVAVPEGASTTSTSILYKYTDLGQLARWRRYSYPWVFSTIYREPDGKIIAGTTDGKLVQLETGTQDDTTDIAIVAWTPFDDAGFPLNRKDPFDFTLKGDTGNANLSIAIHKDGSTGASATLTAALNGIDTFIDDIDGVGVCRSLQYRMTGSFSTFKIAEYNAAFRPRPQMRTHVDSGYLRKAGEDLIWYRRARVMLCASADVSLRFYFDDTLYATKDVTVTADKATVYEIPLGREYKGYQPRIEILKKDQASTVADAGFELYWLELRQRPSGNITNLDVRKVFTDLAIPLEQKEKPQ